MNKFLFWFGNVLIALSLVLQLVNLLLSTGLGLIGLILSVISGMKSEHEHRKQLEQERQERISSAALNPYSRESLMQTLYPDPKKRPKS